MKYTPRQYATAFWAAYKEAPEKEQKTIIRNFLTLLRKNRDWFWLERIMKEVKKLHYQESGLKEVEIETASPQEMLRKEIENILGEKILWHEKVNAEVIAGVKILINDELLIDATAQGQLRKMLRKH